MEKLIINHSNGNSTNYKLVHAEKSMPIAYHESTNEKVISSLEYARKNRIRIKIYLGDVETGKCWNEEHDTVGYIGLSKGNEAYFPILVYNERSYGGGSILDHCIIKIKEAKGGKILFQAYNFQQSKLEVKEAREQEQILGYSYSLYIDGELYSNHKALKQAENLKAKLS